MATLLILAATGLVLLSLRELLLVRGERGPAPPNPGAEAANDVPRWMSLLPILGGGAAAIRLMHAGGAGGMTLRGLAMTRIATASFSLAIGIPMAALLPTRAAPLSLVALAALGLALPDLLLTIIASRRQREILSRLPDAIDLLAIGVAGGRSLRAAITELSRAASGALARELAMMVAELEAGSGLPSALARLRTRVPAAELAALTLAIERSARLGSPLVDELHRQTLSLREDARRRVADQAARAAPKIQLVIALVLVPSVLIMVAAAIVANADRLFAF